jgi:hypothetical protein
MLEFMQDASVSRDMYKARKAIWRNMLNADVDLACHARAFVNAGSRAVFDATAMS